MDKKQASAIVAKLIVETSKRYFAPEEYIRRMTAAVISQGNIFQESFMGKGKSTYAALFSSAFDVTSGKVSGNPGMDESQFIAALHLGKLVNAGIEEIIWRPFIHAKVKNFEEINRLPPHGINALMPVISDEQTAFHGDQQFKVERHVFIASANPNGHGNEGTWNIDVAVKDRFDFCFVPPRLTRRAIEKLTLQVDGCRTPMPKIASGEELDMITDLVEAMEFEDGALTVASVAVAGSSACVHGEKEGLKSFPACCKECEFAGGDNFCSTVRPLSPRIVVSSVRKMAAALALIDGCEKVMECHVLEALPYALYHRVEFSLQSEEHHRDQEISAFVARVQQKATKIAEISRRKDWTKSELLKLSRSRDPLIQEEAQAILGTIGPVKQSIETMSAAELASFVKDGLGKPDELALAAAYLEERKMIRVACTAAEIDIPQWWDNFKTPENEMLLTANGWEYMLADLTAPETYSVPGVEFVLEHVDDENRIITIKCSDAQAADDIRDTLEANSLNLLPVTVNRDEVLAKGRKKK